MVAAEGRLQEVQEEQERRSLQQGLLCSGGAYRIGANQLKAVNPQFAFYGTAFRYAGDPQYEQVGVRSGGESAIGLAPEIGVAQIVAHVEGGLAIEVLNCELGAAGAVHLLSLVER